MRCGVVWCATAEGLACGRRSPGRAVEGLSGGVCIWPRPSVPLKYRWLRGEAGKQPSQGGSTTSSVSGALLVVILALPTLAFRTLGILLGIKDRPSVDVTGFLQWWASSATGNGRRCFPSCLLGEGSVEDEAGFGSEDESAVKCKKQLCEGTRSQGRKVGMCCF